MRSIEAVSGSSVLPQKSTRLECPISFVSRRLGCMALSEEWCRWNVQEFRAHVHTQGLPALAESFGTCNSTFCLSRPGFLTFWHSSI